MSNYLGGSFRPGAQSMSDKDMDWFLALAKSLKLDVDTAIQNGPTMYTAGANAMIHDKVLITNNVRSNIGKMAGYTTTDMTTPWAVGNTLLESVSEGMKTLLTWQAVPGDGPDTTKPYDPEVPFCQPPFKGPSIFSYPSDDTIKQLVVVTGYTSGANLPGSASQQTQKAAEIAFARSQLQAPTITTSTPTSEPTAKSGVPTLALVAGGAVAIFLMTR
jgi:hypothetical protein